MTTRNEWIAARVAVAVDKGASAQFGPNNDAAKDWLRRYDAAKGEA